MLGYLNDPRLVHEGSHSLVYRGHLDDDRPVVVKLTRAEYPSERRLTLIRREHEYLCRIDSPSVIRPVGLVPDGHRLALLLDDQGGQSAALLLRGTAGIALDSFFRVAIDLADGLAAIHSAGLLHLDLKPSNVVVHPATWRAQVIDLGLAAPGDAVAADTSPRRRVVGSLPYLAPEQTGRLSRGVDGRSDLYSLGATLYELLTGRPPFDAPSPAGFVHRHLATAPEPAATLRSDCPAALSELLDTLLRKDPHERYQSAWGVRVDLVRVRDQWLANISAPVALRTRDVPNRPFAGGRLHGREVERAAMHAAVERAASGSRELLLIAGPSGVGKSFLIRRVGRRLASEEGLFVEGKFDQFRRNVPYDSLIQAFRTLTRQLLAERPGTLSAWRSAVQDAVGVNGQVLLDMIPELELLIGPQPSVAQLGPRAALNRFGLVFGSFISVFASPGKPLVLFLDDLQWADDASLALLAVLVTDTGHRGLLVVGAYRDNEVSAEHSLLRTVASIQRDGGHANTVVLEPLPADAVASWLRDSFGGGDDDLRRRATLLVDKTGGNPFFLTRLVGSLQDDGVLTRTGAGWAWDDDALARRQSTENVAELLSRRLDALPAPTRAVLQVAACLGAQDSLRSIAVASDLPHADDARDLLPALQAGLLLLRQGSLEPVTEGKAAATDPPNDVVLAFLHDRVQQTVYDSISGPRRAELHRDIGHRLLARWDAEAHEDELFAIVDHLNTAAGLLDEAGLRLQLARLDLRAARLARNSGAYDTATNLLDVALSVLPPDGSAPRPLVRELHLERGVNRAQLGLGEQANDDFTVALDRSADALERVDVRADWIHGLLTAADYLGVLHQGFAALRELGVVLPATTADRLPAGMALLEETLQGLDIEEIRGLEHLPPIDDPVAARVASILSAISPSAHMTDGTENWFVWVAFRGLKLFRERGNSAASCHGYSLVGMTLCAIGDVDRGTAFHRLAIGLAERFDDVEQLCRTSVCFGFHQPWRDSLARTTETGRRGWRQSLQAGDWFNAQWSAVTLLRASLHSGASLTQLREAATECGEFLARRGPEMAALSRPMIELVDHLSGAAAAGSPLAATDTDWFEVWEPLENEALRVWGQTPGLMALLFDGRDADVCRLARRMWPRYEVFRRFGDGGELHFLHGLAAARLALQGKDTADEAEEQLAALAVWADESPASYGAKAATLRAAVAEARGDQTEALDGFLTATQLAADEGIHHVEALASLSAARIQAARGRRRYAELHRLDARQALLRWGAVRLATTIVPGEGARAPGQDRRPENPWRGSWSNTSSRSLDVEAVLGVADAIASRLELDALLHRMLELAVENAGADSGVLIRHSEDGLRVRARWHDEKRGAEFQPLDLPLEDAPFLCVRAAHYVVRTGEPILVHDADQDPRFATDPHIVRAGVRSLLGLPLRRGGTTAAVLLLENRLTSRAFTEERIRLLTTLSSQMAIALDNADLVAQLQAARDVALARGDDLQGEVLSRDRALDDARRMQSALFEALTQGVCGLTDDGTVVLANPAAHALLGVEDGGLLGRSFHAAFHADEVDCRLCTPGEAHRQDTTFARVDGSPLAVKCVALGLADTTSGVARVLSFHDIGPRLQFEAQSLHARKLEAVGQLVAGIAHEFNNLLTPMTGHLRWLRADEDPDSQRDQALHDIELSTARAEALIRQLLAFGRRSKIFQSPVEVVGLVEDLVSQLADSIPATVDIRFVRPGEELWARGDAQQLKQALANVFRNAIHALAAAPGDGGSIEVSISGLLLTDEAAARGDDARAGSWVQLWIRDDGPGIAPDVRDRIFEPFFTTREFGVGTGLGLPVVLGIVRQHGGWVEVQDRPGGGTEVGLYLPMEGAGPTQLAVAANADAPPPGEATEAAGRRALVIDDERVVRTVAAMILERAGFEVITAEDGSSGLGAARSGPAPDVVLLDLSMPGIDGWETLRLLRAGGFEGRVVLTSGFNLGDEGPETSQQSADAFLHKPFTADQLLAAVGDVLEGTESAP